MTVGSCITLCLALRLATGGLGHRGESAKHNSRMLAISASGNVDSISDASYFAEAFTHNDTTPTMHNNTGPPESSPPPVERPLQKGLPDGTSVKIAYLKLTSSFTQFAQAAISDSQTIMREAAQGFNSTLSRTEEALVHGAGNFSTGNVAVMMNEFFRVASLTPLSETFSQNYIVIKKIFQESGPEQGVITRETFAAGILQKLRASKAFEELEDVAKSKREVEVARQTADEIFREAGKSEKMNFEEFWEAMVVQLGLDYPRKDEVVEAFRVFDQDARGHVYENQIRQRAQVFKSVNNLIASISYEDLSTLRNFFSKLHSQLMAFTFIDGILHEMEDGDAGKVFGVKDVDSVIDYAERKKKEKMQEKFKTIGPDANGEITREKFVAAVLEDMPEEIKSKDLDVDKLKLDIEKEIIEVFERADQTGNPEKMNFKEFLDVSPSPAKTEDVLKAFQDFDEGTRGDIHERAQVFKVIDGILQDTRDYLSKLRSQIKSYMFIDGMVDEMKYLVDEMKDVDGCIDWQDFVARLFDFEGDHSGES